MVEGHSPTERKQLMGHVRRRDVLIAGAVGTGALLVRPLRTLAASPRTSITRFGS